MSRWERRYSFSSEPSELPGIVTFRTWPRWFNYNSLELSYLQAGFEEFRPRRVFYRGSEPFDIDDRQYASVFGRYDIPTHTAYIWACGPNFTDPKHPYIKVQ
jgi:hypothetical protein